MLPGIFPFGIITGVAMVASGIEPLAAMAMSIAVYAGASMVASAQLLASGSPALLVILATGFYQVSDRDWDLGDFWLSGALTIIIVISAILGGYFIPEDRKLQAMVERDIAASGTGEIVLSEEYQRRARREGIVGGITGVLLVIAIYLMVTKPGL